MFAYKILSLFPGMKYLMDDMLNNVKYYRVSDTEGLYIFFNILLSISISFFILKCFACFYDYLAKDYLTKRIGYFPLIILLSFWFCITVITIVIFLCMSYYLTVGVILLQIITYILNILSYSQSDIYIESPSYMDDDRTSYEKWSNDHKFVSIFGRILIYNLLTKYYINKRFKKYNNDFNTVINGN